MPTEFKTIKYNIVEETGFITLATPPGNVMNTLFFSEFYEIIKKIKTDNNIRGLILNSEGRHFSSGADTKELLSIIKKSGKETPEIIKKNRFAFNELSEFNFPVISCIKGVCYGSALELALYSHIRIATKNALFALPETGFDFIPGLAGTIHSVQCMGKAETMKFVLSGNSLTSEEALKSGLIDFISEKNMLTENAVKIIKSIRTGYRKEFKKLYLRKVKQSFNL